ncbi:shikimate dehydrogenase [Nocardioides sp. Root122]|uniref:shikimate dehydrogenase n=1 Tax=Nocardioides TaxID=1839 RepID=UPI0007027C8A|nr:MULTISPECIES: shikimate dehydrogenase [Nocardioides]KQV72048.1 shikimate dehydrogenase [Nocardioides sp. Root122]MCK9824753.1 shikimate dehydrogenase [Nocardioides cavernae]
MTTGSAAAGSPARRCGVLGDPVAHSLSPVLHRAGYAAVGLDWSYDAHRVPAGGLAGFLDGLDDAWRGLSLTMPLKREAFDLADRLTERARRAGGVNTVVLEDDGTRTGDNTDLPGAAAAIRERTSAPLTSAVVLGGGATATSVGLAVADLGVRTIAVAVRDESRAAETLAALRGHPSAPEVRVTSLGDEQWTSGADLGAGGSAVDVVVSTIPAAAQSPDLVARCAGIPVVFEALYDPWPTPLAADALASGRVVVSGMDLLVHQAALQFELFTGRPAPVGAMRDAGERALAARNPA